MRHLFYHEPKSYMAYQYDEDTIHLRLFVAKGTAEQVALIYGDPFLYRKNQEGARSAWRPFGDGVLCEKVGETDAHDVFFIAVKPKYRRMKYAFLIDHKWLYGAKELIDLDVHPELRYHLFSYFNFPFLNNEDLYQAPKWASEQVWYSIFPDRFHNGQPELEKPGIAPWGQMESVRNDSFFGGDLQGITEKLPYLHALGFTGIYLTPIFTADTAHKYDTIDYLTIDPAFGSQEDFKAMVSVAHALDMKVMLDAVFNHCSIRHPFFLDVIEKGQDSPYYDGFYIIDSEQPVLPVSIEALKNNPREAVRELDLTPETLNYRTFAFTPYMPKMNPMHPLIKAHLFAVVKYWMEEMNVDGWRLDVSNEIPHAFWREFRQLVKSINQDAYIVGENWDNANAWLGGEQFDAVMNYEILFPIWQFFGRSQDFPAIDALTFTERIVKVLNHYPLNVLENMYNLVDSHDTTRIATLCQNKTDLIKLVYLFLFTFPGSPSVFYGGEIGLEGGHDPDNRRCMPWDESAHAHPLKSFMQRLIGLRKDTAAWRSARYTFYETGESTCLMFAKEDCIFVINNSGKKQALSVPDAWEQEALEPLFLEKCVHVRKAFALLPYGFGVYRRS